MVVPSPTSSSCVLLSSIIDCREKTTMAQVTIFVRGMSHLSPSACFKVLQTRQFPGAPSQTNRLPARGERGSAGAPSPPGG